MGTRAQQCQKDTIMFVRSITTLKGTEYSCWEAAVKGAHDGGNNVIVTHDGVFHADEVLAVAMLAVERALDNFVVIRTRTIPTNLSAQDWVIDVGGGPYDHHGSDRKTYPNGVIKAACGKVAEELFLHQPRLLSELQRRLLWAVEAQDNGQSAVDLELGSNKMGFISSLNPPWDAQHLGNTRFTQAVNVATVVLMSVIENIEADIRGEAVLEAVQDDEIVVLEKFVPWTAWAVEKWPKAHFVVFPAASGKGFNAQAVPLTATPGDFRNRGGFPKAWGGLRDEALAEVSGIPGAIFCHAGLFLGVWDTQEHAIEAAKAAIAATQVVASP